jgi:PAS domain S-box-containing protein
MENFSVFNSSHTPMLVIESEGGKIRDGNPAASSYYGYTIEELKKLNISDINTLSKQEISMHMRKANKVETMYFEFKHRLSNGDVREVEVYSGPIEVNNEVLLLSIIHDTQYKKEMEQKILVQESYFKSLYENSPEAIVMLDSEFRVVNINKSFERIFQYSIEDMRFQNITEILCDENMYDESKYFKDSIKRGEFVRTETQRRRRDGKLIDISFLGYPILSNGEQLGVYGVYTDITKNKIYEEELKNAKMRAEEVSKFKTKFIANVAHEIRTPMNGIVGIIDILDGTQLTTEQKEYFEMLRYSAERLSIIINDVLDISKIEAGKLEIRNERFNIKQLLEDLGRYFRIQAVKKDLDFNLNIDMEMPSFLIGDADKVNQVLFNLLANAIKFTDRGAISLEVVTKKRKAKYLDMIFSINDTGIGIPLGKVDYLFEDFSQLDSANTRKYSGTGLGLSIARKLVELMGGNISVASEYGKGSTFTFEIRLKISDAKEEKSQESRIEDHTGILSDMNILVIEDERINQQIIKSFLEKKNCTVTITGNGKEALKVFNLHSFDIILMDIFMPGLNGVELAKIIREKEKERGIYTPIIVITAAVMNEDKVMYNDVGIDGCITKPFGKNQFYSVIENVLTKKNKGAVYDLKPLLEIVDGNQKLIKEIIDEVASIQYEQEFLGKIEKYIINKDFKNLAKQAHKFKGSISHFRIDTINNVLTEIEESCSKRNSTSLNQLLRALKNEYINLKVSLIAYSQNIRD